MSDLNILEQRSDCNISKTFFFMLKLKSDINMPWTLGQILIILEARYDFNSSRFYSRSEVNISELMPDYNISKSKVRL